VGYIKRSFSQTFFRHFHLRLKMFSSSESHASFSNLIISRVHQVMKKYCRIWMNRTWLFFIAWRLLATPTILSHCMRLRSQRGNSWTQELVFKMFWLQSKLNCIFSKLWPTSPWWNLTKWSQQSWPMHNL
jgi:hypothetical protein